MAVGYPPQPVYPNGIDSDYTLFLVYNTTEADLVEDNEPWAEEIVIKPRGKTQYEIWADNGFANINGELLYYDAVEKDSNGKVYKLKRCARNLSGAPTQFNAAGNVVRGFVVAEHHNQLVDAIMLTEKFIGYNFTSDEETVDWRVRNLAAVPIIEDDFGCPDVTLFFDTVSSDPSAGTVVNYRLDIKGSFNEFTLSFGDGASTSSLQQGTHTYAANANIDPVISIKNKNCQSVQTPPGRSSVNAPQTQINQVSYSAPNSPTFTFPNINVAINDFPEPEITFPPFQFPCFPEFSALALSSVNVPSIVMFQPPINLPSFIQFEDISIPSFIAIGTLPSILNISILDITVTAPNISLIVPVIPNISLEVPAIPNISVATPTFPNLSITTPTFPSLGVAWGSPPSPAVTWGSAPAPVVSWTAPPAVNITWGSAPTVPIGWTPVPTVNINWGSPPNVSLTYGTPPNISMSWGSPPNVNINWGSPPTVQVNVTVTCPSTPLALAAADPMGSTNDMLGIGKDLEVQYDISGFPSEIKVIPPNIPDVRIIHDVPSEIFIKSPEFPKIKFEVPEFRDIRILPPETPLTVEAIGIPTSIKLESEFRIPDRVELFMPVKIPEVIRIEHDIPNMIRIEGLPDVIRIEHDIPKSIKIEMPDKMPEIDLVYKGSPIPVQIQIDFQKLLGDENNLPCFAMVPCGKR